MTSRSIPGPLARILAAGLLSALVLAASPAAAEIWYRDLDEDGYGTTLDMVDLPIQPPGYVAIAGDCDDEDPARHPDAVEICNDIDDDCDYQTDEDCVLAWYPDGDGDGFGLTAGVVYALEQPVGHVAQPGDCDDLDPDVFPFGCETCDGKDNDCDGATDDDCGPPSWRDQDGDGYGDPTLPYCSATIPPGYVDNDLDCDDNASDVNPGAPEICDLVDNDCDGVVDDGVTTTWYRDADYDEYGDPNDAVESCEQPNGYVPDGTDCDDQDPQINPGWDESCDGIDNDCDGQTDEAPAHDGGFVYFSDLDLDGFGGEAWGFCTEPVPVPDGFVALGGDCDDGNPEIRPGATEVCDGVDNDCDGETDEGLGVWWYPDADQDGYGFSHPYLDQYLCPGETPYPIQYWATNDLDCAETDPAVHPGAEDVCNFADDDCDGEIDEDCAGLSILSILDVGNDQGRHVRVRWSRHALEIPGGTPSITWYTLYRRIDAWKCEGAAATPEPVPNSPPGDWDWVATLPAVGQDVYSLVAPTLCDSTDAGVCWSVFFVRAHTADTFVFMDAVADSGYSIDNLFPSAPQGLAAAYAPDRVTLTWQPAPIDDLRQYRVYRGEGEFPCDAAHLAQATTQPVWIDPVDGAWDLSYLVTVVDLAGNESEPAAPQSVTGLDDQGGTPAAPAGWALLPPAPNPFNPTTTLTYDVPPGGGTVLLQVFDVGGREIRTLVGEHRAAGRHQVVWDGQDSGGRGVPSGAYLCRLTAGGRTYARTVILAK